MSDDLLKKIVRRLESVEKLLNMIFKDREVMEETHIRVGTLHDEMKLLKERIEKLEKRSSADMKEVKEKIEETNDILTTES